MGELNIKGIDETILESLAEMAKAHDRTIEAEALQLLRSEIERRGMLTGSENSFDRLAVAKRISAMTPKDRPQTASLEILREERSR